MTEPQPPAEDLLPWRARRRRQPEATAFLSPVVGRLVVEHGVDPASVAGSGAGGRVTREDVLAAAAGAGSAIEASAAAGHDEVIPFNRVRRRAAVALLRSKSTAAHAWCALAVDFSAVDATRRSTRDRFREEEGFSLTYLPFVARAVVDALDEFPQLNASVADPPEGLLVHADTNLGFAVDLDNEGLVVPVVHDAGSMTLRSIARSVHDLARRARGKRLQPDDVAGVTFTITNPGAAGTWLSVPIIHQPAVAILSTDGVRKRVVARGGALAVRPVGHLGLSFDNRAVDAPYAAAFLSRVGEIIEGRDWSAEL